MKYISICNQINQLNHYTALQSSNKIVDFVGYYKDIKVDIQMQNMYGSTVWGYLKNDNSQPVINQKVMLVKQCLEVHTQREYFEIVAQTYTNEEGYYMMEVYAEENTNLNIIVDTEKIEGKKLVTQDYKKNVINTSGAVEYMKRKEESYRTCTNYVKFNGDRE